MHLGQWCMHSVARARLALAAAAAEAVVQRALRSTPLAARSLSRLLAHPQMLPLRPQLDTSRVLPVLVQRFEGLLDRILRKEARAEHPPSADAG